MAEYVEKKDVKAVIKRRLGKMDLFESLFNADIDAMPAADVAPVVHGRWDGEKDHGEFREVKCTACGGILLVKWSTRLSEYNYCPNCGARMDGDRT